MWAARPQQRCGTAESVKIAGMMTPVTVPTNLGEKGTGLRGEAVRNEGRRDKHDLQGDTGRRS